VCVAVPGVSPARKEFTTELEGYAGGKTVGLCRQRLPSYTNGHPRFLYALFVAIDANFRLKQKDVSSEEKDPGLGNGWAFYCEVLAYMQHVKRNWNQKQDVRFLFPFFYRLWRN
jgi:hypothetical protein